MLTWPYAAQLLEVTASVLANLCVSYIMTSNNELAEELMRHIETQEERAAFQASLPLALPRPARGHAHATCARCAIC